MPSLDEARKTVTVLFCDVEGSTSLGEAMDPESLRQVMLRFFEEMRVVLERHGGSVAKYIGDAVMAVFGIPRLREDDAVRAVKAAEEMQSALARLNEELDARFGVGLRIRIGLNTGEVVVGDRSSGEPLVLGDPVNVAARLEGAADPGTVLLGAETYALVRDHVTAEPVGPLELKGKSEPVRAYRLVGTRPTRISRPDTPFVGREQELELLRSAYARCVAERVSLLAMVLGPAGIGKSRLSRELMAALEGDALVLSGRSLPYGDAITFWPAVEIVKQACGIGEEEAGDDARAKLQAAVAGAEDAPLIVERLSGVLDAGGGPGIHETFWAIRRLLEWIGRRRAVVVVFDDVHWAEPALLDLIDYLVGWTRSTPLLLVTLARPDLLDEHPTWGTGAAVSISLSPLDADRMRELLRALAGPNIDERVTARIAESAGGNVLFLEELLRMLEEEGSLRRRDGHTTVTDDPARVAIPASIQALLGSRLDRLSSEEQSVVRCASVVGEVFWWGAVTELVPDAVRPNVGSHLQTLVRKDLIQPDASTFAGEDGFRFRHVLLQDAAYRSTPKQLRAQLHERFAAWLARTAGQGSPEHEEVLGYHLECAVRYRSELGEPSAALLPLSVEAARPLASAGRRALQRRDVAAAADLLGRAAGLLPEDQRERPGVLVQLAEALVERGDLAAAEGSLDEAERLAEATGDDAGAATAGVLRLSLLQSTGPKRLGDHELEAERLIAVLERAGDDAGVARAWRVVGDLRASALRYGAADEALATALTHARRAGDVREEVECLVLYVGSGVYGPAHVSEVGRRAEELLASNRGIAGTDAPALRALAIVGAMSGRFDEARHLAERARVTLEEFGFRLRASWVWETVAAVERLAGDHVSAEKALRTGLAAASDIGEQGFQATIAGLLAHALVAQDRLDEADELASMCASAAAPDDLASQVLWRTARARVLAGTARAEEGEAVGRDALALVERTDDINMHADTLVDLAAVVAGTGRGPDAGALLARAIELYDAKGNAVGAEAARARRRALAVG